MKNRKQKFNQQEDLLSCFIRSNNGVVMAERNTNSFSNYFTILDAGRSVKWQGTKKCVSIGLDWRKRANEGDRALIVGKHGASSSSAGGRCGQEIPSLFLIL